MLPKVFSTIRQRILITSKTLNLPSPSTSQEKSYSAVPITAFAQHTRSAAEITPSLFKSPFSYCGATISVVTGLVVVVVTGLAVVVVTGLAVVVVTGLAVVVVTGFVVVVMIGFVVTLTFSGCSQ